MIWTHEVENPAAVPPEYLTVDESKIRQAVKNGVRQIVGVRIFEKPDTQYR